MRIRLRGYDSGERERGQWAMIRREADGSSARAFFEIAGEGDGERCRWATHAALLPPRTRSGAESCGASLLFMVTSEKASHLPDLEVF